MRSRLSKVPQEEAPINLTPLIDVVFVILIMFIVAAPLLDMDRVDLAPSSPSCESAASHSQSPIIIHVLANNSIFFNKERVSLTELKRKLTKARSLYPKASIDLYHDKSAHFGTYQSIKGVVEEAGFAQLNVILKP